MRQAAHRTTLTSIYAALTGDIVASTQLMPDQLDEVRSVISHAANSLAAYYARSSPRVKLEFFRGDSWQLLLKQPQQALRYALVIKSALLNRLEVDTRVSIGIGALDRSPGPSLSTATGEAFTLSGRALDKKSAFAITGALPKRSGAMGDWFVLALHLCSSLSREWTRRQAEIVCVALTLRNATHEEVGETLSPPIRKQSVTESLDGAGWRGLSQAIDVFETTNWATIVGLEPGLEDNPKALSDQKQVKKPVTPVQVEKRRGNA